MSHKITYAIIPARSDSKGLPNKNIRTINEKPLIAYSINTAKALNVNKIICSTDSEEYADIAKNWGAEVPFLRSKSAAVDDAMEHDILQDLYFKFKKYKIKQPDYLIWLRPTFVFRDILAIRKCMDALNSDDSLTSARTVCESESRLYSIENNILKSDFDDCGKSMIRRQDVPSKYKVYSTDIIRADKEIVSENFLGNNVYGVQINQICGFDIDNHLDFQIVKSLVENSRDLVSEFIHE